MSEEPGRRIVIVGGVAGGASAAARLRRLDERASIVVFERSAHASFANCGLPYYVGGEITDRSKLLVAGPRQLHDWLRLDVRTGTQVLAIDRQAKAVEVEELGSGRRYREPYDMLVLAPGAAPVRPPALLERVGEDHPRVRTLRNLDDMDRIKAVVDQGAREAVILGGGFIGLELAEQLARRGVRTAVIELAPQLLLPFDPEMTRPVERALRGAGVEVRLGAAARSLEPTPEGRIRVIASEGNPIDADLVVVAVGVRPESRLASAAGLETNERGAIRVNDHLQTSDPAIYAVGDAIEVAEPVLGGRTQIPLAGPANRQGRTAADHALAADPIAAERITFRGSQGTAIVRVFETTAAMTGLTEKALAARGKRRHVDYGVVVVHPTDHAGYYPGARRMMLKLIYERPGGRVLGAQAVGGEGVDKRIDVLSIAVQLKASVFDLEQAELCYAPQFGSAKDAVNMAAFQAANAIRGLTRPVLVADLSSDSSAAPAILDVRTAAEHAAGAIPGALSLPLEELRDRLDEVPTDRPIVTYCGVGMRGYLAERILRQRGFTRTSNLSGGYASWSNERGEPSGRSTS